MKKILTAFFAIITVTVMAQSLKGYQKSQTGLYSRFFTKNKGIKPREGDIVKLIVSYKTSKDSILFDSKINSQDGTPYIEFPLSKTTFKGSFEDALGMMSEGDSASFLINADSVYLKTFMTMEVPSFIAKGSMLTFNVKLEKITPREVYEELQRAEREKNMLSEQASLKKYLGENKITVQPTTSGLYYVEKTKGTGAFAGKGSRVKVHYTGRFLDGTIFDTSDEAAAKAAGVYDASRPYEPIEFNLGEGQVIPGWEEGITLMNAGTKAVLILPSSIAYGATGAGPIAPYSPLVFDVELVSFAPAE